MRIAVLGDPTFVKGFELIGAEGFIINDNELKKRLIELVNSNKYGLIILPERFTDLTRDLRERLLREERLAPIFAFLPDYTGIRGKRFEEVKKYMFLAMGFSIKVR